MDIWAWAALAAIICISWALWRKYRKPRLEPGTVLISSDIDRQEFSRIFAKALLDETGRKVLVPLLQASGNNVTWREMAILKCVLGEETREYLVETIRAMGDQHTTYREAEILNRQMDILTSVVGKEKNHSP